MSDYYAPRYEADRIGLQAVRAIRGEWWCIYAEAHVYAREAAHQAFLAYPELREAAK